MREKSTGPLNEGRAPESCRDWTDSRALYVASASPRQNGYAESFHRKLRDEFLDREGFEGEPQAWALGLLWREEYDTDRPHGALGHKTAAEYATAYRRCVPIEENPKDGSDTGRLYP